MRNNIFTALLAAAVVVLLYIVFTIRPYQDNKIAEQAKEVVRLEVDKVGKEIDKKGFQHAVIEDKQNVVKSLSHLSDSSRRELDSVKALLSIKDKQLSHYISYSATLEGKLLKAVKTDTSFIYTDKWATIEYVPDTTDGVFNFTYNADINYAEYWRKSWFLAPKKHYVDFWISDPRATINGVKRVKIESKEPFTKVDLNSMVLIDGDVSTGPDVGISLGRFKVGASYLYNLDKEVWKPYFYGKYKILGF